ncbi:MAG: uroporphyrinogen-III C-methyltransferase [PVC group bacterium]|nr:uroporphyrinogen-III C-methyltransferase [PVC group bacterium]
MIVKRKYNPKVYLVGVGPGDEQLVSKAAIDYIAKADVIIHDRLIPEFVLQAKKSKAKLIAVGKTPKKHPVPQDKINALLLKHAKNNNIVVRLKGGDPFLFGRGSEEAQVLAKAGIYFEVISGISAGIAAAAYAGIPLTHRGIASSVVFVTGHEDPYKKGSSVDWKVLAKHTGTLVIFMGMTRLADITNKLIAYGMNKKTPACVVQQGTLPEQRSVVGTVADIAAWVKKKKLTNPAIIIIGKVVALRKDINWYETKSLFGKKILVTRPKGFAQTFGYQLKKFGAQVVIYPLIEIKAVKNIKAAQVIKKIRKTDWTIFTSRNAVDICFDLLKKNNKDARVFNSGKIAVLGEGTNDSLTQRGVIADLMPKKFVMESLVSEFKKINMKGKRVYIPHSRQGRRVLIEELKALGAKIEEDFIYEVKCPRSVSSGQLKKILKEESFDMVTFTSSSAVNQFMKLLGKEKTLLKKQQFAVIGPVTNRTLQDYGYESVAQAKQYNIDGLCKALGRYFYD